MLSLLCASGLAAETVSLRSGEHDTFSRIVVTMPEPADWTLGRAEAGYQLQIARPELNFDLSDVYRLIPRTRLARLAPGDKESSLTLTLGCECHAIAFETASGAIVIDVADGPPSADSPFEKPLDKPEEQAQKPDLAQMAQNAEDAVASWRVPAVSYRPEPPAAPRLALFWRNRDVQRSDPGAELPAEPETTLPAALPDAAPQAIAIPGDLPSEPAAAPMPAPLHVDILPPLPDPRVAQAEADLLRQLSRAASQGLVEAKSPPTQALHPGPEYLDTNTGSETAAMLPEDAPPGSATDSLAIHTQTSIDRDTFGAAAAAVTAEGADCLSDADFALSEWGDDRPATIQIADKRGPLVGEFDRPAPQAVLDLARLYIFLGFGAEARAVLKAFAMEETTLTALGDMALILDGATPDPSHPLATMTDCDTAAALWAVLARPGLSTATTVNQGAVLRAFSALPPHLRRSLGPPLSDRFLSVNATDAARAIRDAIARAPGDPGAAISMIDAGIDFARGDAEAGEAALAGLADVNDPLSLEALIRTIRSRLDRGQPVDPRLADSAEALAFERKDGPMGSALNQLHILSRASDGEFARAFAAYRRWAANPPDAVQAETLRSLFARLADSADDAVFLVAYFDYHEDLEQAGPDILLRSDLAQRLVMQGFPDQVRSILKGEAAYTERGRRLLARAALAEYAPAEAIAQLAGITGEEAEGMRAEALTMMGDHRAAAATFVNLGDSDAAGRAAWRGGDWIGAAENAPAPMREAVQLFGLAPGAATLAAGPLDPNPGNPTLALQSDGPTDVSPRSDTPGPLAQSRSLIDDSRALRDTIDSLMQATGDIPMGGS